MSIQDESLYYDILYDNYLDDLEFYKEFLGGEVLELGCGTGRLTLPLARTGLNITGLDISAEYLRAAHSKTKKLLHCTPEFIQADMRDFNIDRKFDVIFAPFNTLCFLHTVPDISSCFDRVKKHLKPNGKFIVDVFLPSMPILLRNPNTLYDVKETIDPLTSEPLKISEKNIYNKLTQVLSISYLFETAEKKFSRNLQMKMYFPKELEAYFTFHGFKIVHTYGGYAYEPLSVKSRQQIIVSSL